MKTMTFQRAIALVLATLMVVAILPLSAFIVNADGGYIAKGKLITAIRLQGYQTGNAFVFIQ